ncbi:MAG: SPW repeat protein [Patescibacteria group bacterium]
MKLIHWIIFALAFWVILVPFIGDDIFYTLAPNTTATTTDLVRLLRWDDLFIGLGIAVMALVVVMLEQPTVRTAGLRAMHWMQFGLGTWIATAPFALDFDMTAFTWSHFVTGFFVAIFALIQLNLEGAKH